MLLFTIKFGKEGRTGEGAEEGEGGVVDPERVGQLQATQFLQLCHRLQRHPIHPDLPI